MFSIYGLTSAGNANGTTYSSGDIFGTVMIMQHVKKNYKANLWIILIDATASEISTRRLCTAQTS